MTALENPTTPQTVKRRPNLFRKFAKDERGSNAIEFVMLIFPFTLMMFAVIESGLSFAAQQLMSNATDDVSRSLRVGEILQADATPAGIRDLICNDIEIMVSSGCPGLAIDLKQYTSYGAVPLTIPRKSDGDLNTAGFAVTPGGSGSINQLRVFYRWPVMAPFMRYYIADLPGGNSLLYATLTWKNEPYL
jgi:Flp pilus assembly protein TadG